MADRRYEEELRRDKGSRRDTEAERRIERLADRYRGSDERGYGGGERLGRDWERGDPRDLERLGRDERVPSYDEQRFDRGREGRGDSPSGAFHDQEPHHRDHSRLAGLHDMEDMSELRERYREHVRQRDYQPRYGHGPGVENMDVPRTGAPMPRGRGPKGHS